MRDSYVVSLALTAAVIATPVPLGSVAKPVSTSSPAAGVTIDNEPAPDSPKMAYLRNYRTRTSFAGDVLKQLRTLIDGSPDQRFVEVDQQVRNWAREIGPSPICRAGVRHNETSWKPLDPCLALPHPPATASIDPQGHHAIWTSEASGVVSDLWFMEKRNGEWSRPVFTGVYGGRQKWTGKWSVSDDGRLLVETPVCTFREKEGVPGVITAWGALDDIPTKAGVECANKTLSVIVSDLFVDQDGDDWPDILERRLGTDLTNADTDGDGVKDSRDPSPLCSSERPSKSVEAAVWWYLGLSEEERPIFFDRDQVGCLEIPTVGGPLIGLSSADYRRKLQGLPADSICYLTAQDGTVMAGASGIEVDAIASVSKVCAISHRVVHVRMRRAGESFRVVDHSTSHVSGFDW